MLKGEWRTVFAIFATGCLGLIQSPPYFVGGGKVRPAMEQIKKTKVLHRVAGLVGGEGRASARTSRRVNGAAVSESPWRGIWRRTSGARSWRSLRSRPRATPYLIFRPTRSTSPFALEPTPRRGRIDSLHRADFNNSFIIVTPKDSTPIPGISSNSNPGAPHRCRYRLLLHRGDRAGGPPTRTSPVPGAEDEAILAVPAKTRPTASWPPVFLRPY